MEALLGSDLLGKGGRTATASSLGDCEVVGLYFSAHWCGPCRSFTPQLVDVYNKLRSSGKKFEIVFVSSDSDQKSFDEYYGEMPWLALPFEKRDDKEKLSRAYKVRGIPTLVLLNGDGSLITTGGRAAVTKPEDFPFVPPTVASILTKTGLLNKAGEKVSLESITSAGKYIGIYFSAHWCPPCRKFTPILAETYKKVLAAGGALEIIFVSSDRSKDDFDSYFGEMPWLALPFDERDAKGKLSGIFEVEGIPTFILLGPDMKVVNAEATSAVRSGRDFPWVPPDVKDLDEDGGAINETPCLVVLLEKAEGAWDAADAALKTLAAEQKALALSDDLRVQFFTAKEIGGGITTQVRKLMKLGQPGKEPQVVLVDLPSGGKFHVHTGGVSVESLRALLQSFRTGTIEFQSLEE